MQITLETLYAPAQRPRLAQAIWDRYSCRAYDGAPSVAQWAALSYTAQRYALPGARLALMHVEENFFTGTVMGVGRIAGCTAAAAVIASSDVERSRIHAGILGETFCLEACAMGLATCWVSGTYRKRMLDVALNPGEAVLAVIAVGVPSEQQPKIVRRRKPLEKICEGDVSRWPEEMRRVADAVRQAPSAMNMQPWQLHLSSSRLTIDAPDRAQLELGVALCHAELTLVQQHVWHFGSSRRETAAWAQPK